MTSRSKIIEIKTKKQFDIVDLTDKIKSFIREKETRNAMINIQSLHTTAAVFVQEREPLLLEDVKKHLDRIVPQDIEYSHDDFGRRTVNLCDNECANGHSHCKAVNMPTSVTLNITDEKLQLGAWQRILFIELDRPRDRKVHIQIIGE